jgi:hypothetical protein
MVKDEPRSGRPASVRTSTDVDRVRAFIRQDRHLNGTRHSLQDRRESSHEQIKTMVIIFFDSCCVVHKEFVPPGVTVKQKYYLEVQDHLRKRVMRVRMEIADDWIHRVSSRQRARTHSIVSS